MRLISTICTSKLLILSSALGGLGLPKLSAAATSARLAVSAIVVTTCSIKVFRATNGKTDTDSNCSDSTRPTVVLNPPSQPAVTKQEGSVKSVESDGIGAAEVTVTY